MSIDTDREAGLHAAPRAMIKPLLIIVLIAVVVVGGIFAWQAFIASKTKEYMAKAGSTPQTVSSVTAGVATWQSVVQAVGTLRAVRGADLSAQLAGTVEAIEFESGNEVPAGKLLLRLKPNDDFAKLQQLEAAAELAEQTYKRDQEQFAAQAVSQATLDSDVSTQKSARAQVAAQRALIDEKQVRAPFAGQLGIRQVDVGQYLTAGTAIVTLQALDPILVDFYVPQQALKHLKLGQTVHAAVDTYAGVDFTGSVESINAKVDSASRNVQVRAKFSNADHRLLPGMFANVSVDNGETTSQITLPQSVVTYNPYGDTLFVIENGAAQQRVVKLGATRGDQVAVESGVKAGEVIVASGQMKLHNGTPVRIDNTVLPANDPAPNPPNE